MLYFVFKYNKRKNKIAIQNEGNTFLEITWTVVPINFSPLYVLFGWEGWKAK